MMALGQERGERLRHFVDGCGLTCFVLRCWKWRWRKEVADGGDGCGGGVLWHG